MLRQLTASATTQIAPTIKRASGHDAKNGRQKNEMMALTLTSSLIHTLMTSKSAHLVKSNRKKYRTKSAARRAGACERRKSCLFRKPNDKQPPKKYQAAIEKGDAVKIRILLQLKNLMAYEHKSLKEGASSFETRSLQQSSLVNS